jgi:hypothetical protein
MILERGVRVLDQGYPQRKCLCVSLNLLPRSGLVYAFAGDLHKLVAMEISIKYEVRISKA